MAFMEAIKLNDLKPGKAKQVYLKGNEIAVYNVDGKIYATNNACLHAQGPLGEGILEDDIITCPLHGWRYDVTNGSCKSVPGLKLKVYKVSIKEDKIMIDI